MTSTTQPSPAHQPIEALSGVGARQRDKLHKLGLRQVSDLLWHLPLRYEDRSIRSIATLSVGLNAAVVGEVRLNELVGPQQRIWRVWLQDASGLLALRFFHFSQQQREALNPGTRVWCFGEVRQGHDSLELVHPEYRILADTAPLPVESSLTPVYPSVAGLQQATLRRLCNVALSRRAELPDLVPAEVLPAKCRIDLYAALEQVHQPCPEWRSSLASMDELPGKQRLAFEELLAHHLSLRRLRSRLQQTSAPALAGPGRLSRQLRAALGFPLTAAQERVCAEIQADVSQTVPMLRLLQGDVGAGKTVVAALACLRCVEAGYQAVLMAPTELLAEQHQRSFSAWCEPLGIEVGWLTGRLTKRTREAVWARLQAGDLRLVVGTHALFQGEAPLSELGLMVVDEQHRFGVHQRLALREKGERSGCRPHQLIMTATPIPRTLAMTAYAELDLSVIDEMPPGRKPVTTVAIPASRRDEVIERIGQACKAGRQAYWVCTLIETAETLQAEAAEATYETLCEALPNLRLALVHGRLAAADKSAAMAAFQTGEVQVLVATTVIEVGVDVPNASLMIIENAERLGLSQLHQLRGRVGRGTEQSSCVLLFQPPLSQAGRQRLQALREYQDGFKLAEIDLALRGPGEMLGTRQTGDIGFRIADLSRHQDLLADVQRAAEVMLRDYPDRVEPLIQRWLGSKLAYGQV